jgi:hypothetical protein
MRWRLLSYINGITNAVVATPPGFVHHTTREGRASSQGVVVPGNTHSKIAVLLIKRPPNLTSIKQQHQQTQQLYRAIYDYQGEDHQFTLRVGDLFTCEQQKDGWWGGMNLRTNRKGWYPCSYVEPVVVATTTNSSSHPSSVTSTSSSDHNKDPGWAAHEESIIPTVHAVRVPSPPPTWSSVHIAGPPPQREGPPSWSTPSPATVSSSAGREASSSGSDVVASVGHWLKNSIAHSSIGNHHGQPPVQQHQTVTVQETQVQRSGSWFFGPSSTTSVRLRQRRPSFLRKPEWVVRPKRWVIRP